MLNTQLKQPTPGAKKLKFRSPPKHALKRYLQASDADSTLVSDKITLSEEAKATPAKSSNLSKVAHVVGLGVALMGVMGAVGCGGRTAVPEANVAVEQDVVQSEQDVISALQDTTQTKKSQPTTLADQLKQETQTVVDEAKEIGQEFKRVRDDLRGADSEEVGRVIGREGRALGDAVVDEVKSEVESTVDDVKKAGQEIKRVRENLRGKSAKEIGQELGKEGKKIGKELGKEGKKIGKAAKDFWRGLNGKKKK